MRKWSPFLRCSPICCLLYTGKFTPVTYHRRGWETARGSDRGGPGAGGCAIIAAHGRANRPRARRIVPAAPAYVYLVRCADGSYYTGWTNDLARRVATHNRGTGARYTRSRRPVTLAYYETLPDATAARRREARLRRLSHAAKHALAVAPTLYATPQEEHPMAQLVI